MSEVKFRQGKPEDAEAIAILFDMANSGLVAEVWGAEATEHETWLDVAKRNILEPHSELSYNCTLIAEVEGQVAGMLIGTRQPEDMPAFDLDSISEDQRPFIALRRQVPGGFLLRDVAVFPQYRNQGICSTLFDLAISMAYTMGAETVFVITHETNTSLRSQCAKRDMAVLATHPVGHHPAYPAESNWLLLTCQKPEGILSFTYKEAATNGK